MISYLKKQLRKIKKKLIKYTKNQLTDIPRKNRRIGRRENWTLTEMYRCPINDSWRTGHVSGISNASSPEFDDLIPDLLLNFSVWLSVDTEGIYHCQLKYGKKD